MRRRSLLAGAAAGLMAGALPLRRAFAQAASAKPIRIGLLHDLSGPFAGAGSVPLSVGAQLAIDHVNSQGGILGKYKIEPVSADSQSKVDVAINEAERLIAQEKVDIVLGVYSSAQAVPLAAKMDEAKKILWINSAIATAVLKDRHLHYVFRPTTQSDAYGEAAISLLGENSKPKLGIDPAALKIALIDEDGPYGTGVQQADQRFSDEKHVGKIVLKESYSASAPDLSSLVTKLKRAHPDVIIHAGYNPDITLFLRQAREAGLHFKTLIGNGAGYSQLDKLRATFGTDVDDFFNIDPAPAQILDAGKLAPGIGDLIKIMVDGYKAKTQATEVPTHVSMGFNNTWILLAKVLPVAVGEIWRRRPRRGAQGGARSRCSARRHVAGLRRQIRAARRCDVRAERPRPAGRHAEPRQGHHRRLAEPDQHRRTGHAAAGLVSLRDGLRCSKSRG